MSRGIDESQREFCEAPPVNIRLLAPAGCGKTHSLLYRCKHLAESKGSGSRFLIITFTRVARDEIKTRLHSDSDFGDIRDFVEVATLNSWGWRRVRAVHQHPRLITTSTDLYFAAKQQLQPIWSKYPNIEAAMTGRKANSVAKSLLESIDQLKSLGFDHRVDKEVDHFQRSLLTLQSIGLAQRWNEVWQSIAQMGVLTSESLQLLLGRNHSSSVSLEVASKRFFDEFFDFWCKATEFLVSQSTFSLEDQKYVAFLDEDEKVSRGSHLSGVAQIDHVLVDEFQDINPLDLNLISAIVKRNRSTLTIIGDDDQAIFEWRGATPHFILNPSSFLGDSFQTYTLARNYRCPRNIVEMSQSLIKHNANRVDKTVSAVLKENAEVSVRCVRGISDAMNEVQKLVSDAAGSGGRTALISRKRSQIIPYQVFFASESMPFCAAEDLQVFLSETFERLLEILAIKSKYSLRQTVTQAVGETVNALSMVLRFPLRPPDALGIKAFLSESGPNRICDALTALESYDGTIGRHSAKTLLLPAIEGAMKFFEAERVDAALHAISSDFSGMKQDYGKAEEDIFFLDPPFAQLVEFAGRYDCDFDRFIDDIDKAKRLLVRVPPDDDDFLETSSLHARPIHLMTAPRAKGKEFDNIVLLDVNEGMWPIVHADTPEKIEAERRLFYVAMTRAKKKLVVLVNAQLICRNLGQATFVPSRFIAEAGLA